MHFKGMKPPDSGSTTENRIKGRQRDAFSLIEVTIALGLLAFAILPVIALLPIGLEMQRSANQGTIETQILQRLTGHYASTEFAELQKLATSSPDKWFFTVDGREVDEADFDRIYDAQVSVQFPLELPASAASTIANHSAAGILVEIAHNPGADDEIFDDASRNHSKKYTIVYRNDRN